MQTTAATSGGFQAAFTSFMYYAGPIVQIVFWVVLAAAAVWACVIFKRYVDFVTGGSKPAIKPAEKPVDVEQFVD